MSSKIPYRLLSQHPEDDQGQQSPPFSSLSPLLTVSSPTPCFPSKMSSIHKKDSDSERGLDVPAHAIDPRTQEELQREIDAHIGVARVEAAEKVYGKYSKWILFISLVSTNLARSSVQSINGLNECFFLKIGSSLLHILA